MAPCSSQKKDWNVCQRQVVPAWSWSYSITILTLVRPPPLGLCWLFRGTTRFPALSVCIRKQQSPTWMALCLLFTPRELSHPLGFCPPFRSLVYLEMPLLTSWIRSNSLDTMLCQMWCSYRNCFAKLILLFFDSFQFFILDSLSRGLILLTVVSWCLEYDRYLISICWINDKNEKKEE